MNLTFVLQMLVEKHEETQEMLGIENEMPEVSNK